MYMPRTAGHHARRRRVSLDSTQVRGTGLELVHASGGCLMPAAWAAHIQVARMHGIAARWQPRRQAPLS